MRDEYNLVLDTAEMVLDCLKPKSEEEFIAGMLENDRLTDEEKKELRVKLHNIYQKKILSNLPD